MFEEITLTLHILDDKNKIKLWYGTNKFLLFSKNKDDIRRPHSS